MKHIHSAIILLASIVTSGCAQMQSNFIAPHMAETKVPVINVTDTTNELLVNFEGTNLKSIRITCDLPGEALHIDTLSKTPIFKFHKRGGDQYAKLRVVDCSPP